MGKRDDRRAREASSFRAFADMLIEDTASNRGTKRVACWYNDTLIT
jgi:hypothetical protein